ncbi:MAG: hypothetical protein ACE366_13195 [Bradymonadia bacterium]
MIGRTSLLKSLGGWVLALTCVGCAGELEDRVNPDEIWNEPVETLPVQEPVTFIDGSRAAGYGLPADGQPGLGDLLAALPGDLSGQPNLVLYTGADEPAPMACSEERRTLDMLPMTVEAVVTLHPRYYRKVDVCGQDERNYGVYAIADDTGGMVVLRDGRVADYTFGDRVRMTIRGVGQLFRQPTDRAVIIADVERIEPARDPDGRPFRPVFFTWQQGLFGDADMGQVRRIQGYVAVQPTNDNFNDMVLSSEPIEPRAVDAPEPDPVCMRFCRTPCTQNTACGDELCGDTICPELCTGRTTDFDAAELTMQCWSASADAELGRRGFTVPVGSQVSVTGPVVWGFRRREIWIIQLGQVEVLADPGEPRVIP